MVLGALIVAENTPLAGPLRYGGSWVLVLESVRNVGGEFGLRDTLPEHGTFLDVHLPRACPATSAGKTNH